MNLPFSIDLKDKVVVVTGAGGVLCSMFVKALVQSGARVALLDLNLYTAQKYADEINQCGYVAKAYMANVLEKESPESIHTEILKYFCTCDILINGAGSNNPMLPQQMNTIFMET